MIKDLIDALDELNLPLSGYKETLRQNIDDSKLMDIAGTLDALEYYQSKKMQALVDQLEQDLEGRIVYNYSKNSFEIRRQKKC